MEAITPPAMVVHRHPNLLVHMLLTGVWVGGQGFWVVGWVERVGGWMDCERKKWIDVMDK